MAREFKDTTQGRLYKCSECGEFLPHTNFYRNRMGFDCISNICKSCANKKSAQWKRDNKDKRNAYQRKYGFEKEARLQIYGPEVVQPKSQPYIDKDTDAIQPKPKSTIVSVNFDNKEVVLTPSINEGEPHVQSQSDGRADDSTSRTAVITNNIDTTKTYTAVSKKESEISNRLSAFTDKIKKETEELEKNQIDYEKEYPDAYQKIMSDEDLSRAFNYKYNEEQRIAFLKREQAMIDKKKDTFEYKSDKDKMRAMYETLLDDNEKKKFDEVINELGGNRQDRFVHDVAKLPEHSFKNGWMGIYLNIKDIQKGIAGDNDFNI